jgi:hypothetical protein
LLLIAGAVALSPGTANANHTPCDAFDPVCLRVQCPDPSRGFGWIYIDREGIPHVDFTDCAGI